MVLAVRFLLILFLAGAASAQRRPVILDTDIGDAVDDALAVALAVKSPELDIRGITTVIDDVEAKTRFAWKQLGLYNRRDIPLVMGMADPLIDARVQTRSRQYELLTSSDTIPDAGRRNAVLFLIETLQKSADRVTIVALGPLTNVALALKTEPRIKGKIERLVVMGGSYLKPESEYNIQRDRAAAQIVFASGVSITAVGLDVTRDLRMREDDLAEFRLADDPAGRFILRAIELARMEHGGENPILFDPLAVAAVIRPDLIESRAGTVTVQDSVTRFQEGSGNVQVAVRAKAGEFLDFFTRRVTGR